jgi:hypothetical protein
LPTLITNYTDQDEAAEENPESREVLEVYLADGSKKQFNKYIVDVVHQIDGYYKLDTSFGEDEAANANQKELDEKEINEYVRLVKKCCFEIDAETLLISCLKNMQYFNKENWRKMQTYIEQLLAIAETEEDRQKASF